ncbi:MAG TPA: ABC transporter permease [Gaiellaceae bacterium]|nr:ABC transporter permease [Gaiellaceae bacterium]
MEVVVRGAWVIAYRELLRYVRERARVISSLAMPLVFLVIFGAGLNRSMGRLTGGVDYLQFMYPGIIAMTVFMSSLMSGLSVVWDREFGFLKEVLVAPLSPAGIVFGKALGAATIALGQALILLLLAPFIGVHVSVMLVLELVPLLLVISFALSGLGLLIASRMHSQQSFQLVMQIVIFPLTFLAGIFFAVNNVPTWMAVVSKLDPLTYGVDAIRRLFLEGQVPATGTPNQLFGVEVLGHTTHAFEDILVVVLLGALLLGAAAVTFGRQE